MNAKQKAYADLQRFAQSFSGVLDAAKELANIGSIEQAADEARAKLKAEQGALDEWLVANDKKADQIKAAEVEAAERLDEANRLMAAASRKSAEAKRLAETESRAILEDAREKAVAAGIAMERKARRDMEKALADANSDLATINAAISTGKADMKAIRTETTTFDKTLTEMKAEMARLRDRLG